MMISRTSRLLRALAVIALGVSLVGCGTVTGVVPLSTELPISPKLQIPALDALPGPGTLTVKQLEEGLRQFVNAERGPVADRLEALYRQWQVRPPFGTTPVLEADLDGDGRVEVVTALNDASSAGGSGTIFVIYGDEGQYRVDRAPTTVLSAGLNAVGVVAGDMGPAIIWSSTSTGANTAYTTLYVATWTPGNMEVRPTEITMAGPRVEIADGYVLVSGGLGGGYGAGTQQRLRTDRYEWRREQFVLVDQQYAASSFAYHRLQDGILAEQWQRLDDAETAYREAMEPERGVALLDETITPEWRDPLAAAVRTFAEFRLDMLQQPDRGAVCDRVTNWADAHPEFLQALNSPWGWANPQWEVGDLCGPLPNLRGTQP